MKLDCDVVKDLYVLYKENELSPKVKKAVEEHLQQCQSCSRVYENEEDFEDYLQDHESEIKPSKEFDEKMKFRIRLRRWKIATIFIAVVLLIYSYFEYVDDRKNILYAVQGASNNVNQMSLAVDSVKTNTRDFGYIFEELNQIQEKYGAIIRELNYFENKNLSSHPNGLFISFEFVDFLEHLNIRYTNNVWTEKDEKALRQMKDNMEGYLKLLEKEGNKLNGVYNSLDLSVLFNPMKVDKMSDLNQRINELSYVYTRFGKFPEEINILTKKEASEILSNIFNTDIEDIEFMEYANKNVKSFGTYSFNIRSEDEQIYGAINAITGELIESNSKFELTDGDLLSKEEIKEKLNIFLNKAYGSDIEFNIQELGINYRFSSNVDWQLYTFEISPQKAGYILDSLYRVYIDGRTGRIKTFRKLEGYVLDESFKDAKTSISIEVQDALKGLKDEIDNPENYIYDDTFFIKSILSRDYQLVFKYVDKNSRKEIFINTNTGKQEFDY